MKSPIRQWCEKTWWRHQMETVSALLAICAGNSPVSGEFPAQRPVTRSFVVFFDLRLNKRLSEQPWGWWFETLSCPLWRHCNDIRDAYSTGCFCQHWFWSKYFHTAIHFTIIQMRWKFEQELHYSKNKFLSNLNYDDKSLVGRVPDQLAVVSGTWYNSVCCQSVDGRLWVAKETTDSEDPYSKQHPKDACRTPIFGTFPVARARWHVHKHSSFKILISPWWMRHFIGWTLNCAFNSFNSDL